MEEKDLSKKEAMLYIQRVSQLSKALWKSVEKDWQQWIKPYDLNINEHHILSIAYHLNGASISDVAKFGVMHVSTAFNFSKKLEERGFLEFSKRENDKRNTYIKLTEEGEKVFLDLLESYDATQTSVYSASLPLKDIYGKFPEIMELMAIVRNIYGDDFMEIFETSFNNVNQGFTEKDGKIVKKTNLETEFI